MTIMKQEICPRVVDDDSDSSSPWSPVPPRRHSSDTTFKKPARPRKSSTSTSPCRRLSSDTTAFGMFQERRHSDKTAAEKPARRCSPRRSHRRPSTPSSRRWTVDVSRRWTVDAFEVKKELLSPILSPRRRKSVQSTESDSYNDSLSPKTPPWASRMNSPESDDPLAGKERAGCSANGRDMSDASPHTPSRRSRIAASVVHVPWLRMITLITILTLSTHSVQVLLRYVCEPGYVSAAVTFFMLSLLLDHVTPRAFDEGFPKAADSAPNSPISCMSDLSPREV